MILAEFEKQARAQPDHQALINGSQIVSYSQLAAWSDEIAAELLRWSPDPTRPIAYLGTNGINLIAAYFGSQKAGLPFLPINRKYPETQILEVFERSESSLCVTDAPELLEAGFLPFLKLPQMPDRPASTTLCGVRPIADDAISLLQCSSGSTGLPKIIPYTQEMARGYIEIHIDTYGLNHTDVVAHLGTYWLESVVATLSVGATVSCLDPLVDGLKLITERMVAERVSILPVYPSFFRLLEGSNATMPDLRLVMLSGDPITRRDVATFEALTPTDAELLNCYASMEATCIAVYRHRNGDQMHADVLPGGKPVNSVSFQILSQRGEPVRTSGIGEIVVQSRYLPKEYIGDPERSRKVFGTDALGIPLYRTGDFGYLDAAGNLHNLGRKDDQVRINGFNVRLSVIEAELLTHPRVTECAIIAKQGERQIVRLFGFYVGDATETELAGFLSSGLPAYMVPKTLVRIAQIPRTVTGKIQRARLDKLAPMPTEPARPLKSETERKVAGFWSLLLEHDTFTTTDSFFDVGGDSLRALELLLMVEQAFGKRIGLDQFVLNDATISGLSHLIEVNDHQRLRVLKAGKGVRKIYVTHVWNGSVSAYLQLAGAFDSDTEVTAITADYSGRSRAYSIRAKAAEAVEHLPDEPERVLVGYSYAALLAIEIARLTPQTRTRLVLIDPFSKPLRRFRRLRYLGALLDERFGSKRPLGHERAYSGDYLYRPMPVNVERACVVHGDQFPEYALSRWQSVFKGQLDVYRQAGGHWTMMSEGSVMQIAQQITNWLSRSAG